MRTLRNYDPIAASVLYVVNAGTAFLVAAIAALVVVNLESNPHTGVHLVVCGVAEFYLATAFVLTRRYHYRFAAYLLLGFYLFVGAAIMWSWGINTPIAVLVFALVIVLAGVLLTARHAIIAGLCTAAILLVTQVAVTAGWHYPDTSLAAYSSFGDVAAYYAVFCMLVLVSWLYNRDTQRALVKARRAEAALRLQQADLKRQVKERTEELRRAQLEEMRQMYHFAKLGQLGLTMLHELGNNLTALTLEIEGLENTRQQHEVARAQQITCYLGNLIETTRQRLYGDNQKQTFDIVQKTADTIDFLRYKAAQYHVELVWQPAVGSLQYTADPESVCQLVAILVTNAIDAYRQAPAKKKRRVLVSLVSNQADVTIRVRDYGKGITPAQRRQLFQPRRSAKKTGWGLGLYIARQTVELQFGGTIRLSSATSYTEFIMTLPKES